MTATGPTRLARTLIAGGFLSPDWHAPFVRVRRADFIPDRFWVRDAEGYRPVDRVADPDRWRRLVYSDTALITQVADPPGVAVARSPTSSASMPRVVAAMLDALRVEEGNTALEIGTGSGYNAALLCERLGAARVTSVDIDLGLTERARDALDHAGHTPTVVTGDGAAGWRPRAPYDRAIATCAVRQVPYAWVEQTAPGGVLVLPWGTSLRNGALLRLVVRRRADGGLVASGPVVGDSEFMWLRAQAPHRDVMAVVRDESEATACRTALDPRQVLGDDDAAHAVGVMVPECRSAVGGGPDGEWTLWLADESTGSWASLDYAPGAVEFEVWQYGPRTLWTEVGNAYRWWRQCGRPARNRFGVTVSPEGQRVWLDQPERTVPARL